MSRIGNTIGIVGTGISAKPRITSLGLLGLVFGEVPGLALLGLLGFHAPAGEAIGYPSSTLQTLLGLACRTGALEVRTARTGAVLFGSACFGNSHAD
jgi:hypothetical protein